MSGGWSILYLIQSLLSFFTISHILKDMQLAVLRSQRLNVSLESSTYIALLFHFESLPAFTIIVLQ